MRDPLKGMAASERELALYNEIVTKLHGISLEMARSIAVNLLINAVRQSVPYRRDAEAVMNELFGRAKTILLDNHYDAVTGRRRSVFPFTQTLEMPLHSDKDNIMRANGKG